MPEMTYRHITMMIWSVARNGESNRMIQRRKGNALCSRHLRNP